MLKAEDTLRLDGTSDGTGTLALGKYNVHNPPQEIEWDEYAGDGTYVASLLGVGLRLLPQPGGFQQVAHVFASEGELVRLESYSARGTLLGRTTLAPFSAQWDAAPDPAGGSLVTLGILTRPGAWAVTAQRFDAAGNPVSAPITVSSGSGARAPFTVAGIDALGYTLVLWEGDLDGAGPDSLRGLWLGRNGRPLTAPFVSTGMGGGSFPLALRPLIGGGLALQAKDTWVKSFPSALANDAPLPPWLAARPHAKLQIVRGGRAYALVAPTPTCQPTIELLVPTGSSCGSVTLPTDSGDCAGTVPTLGRDGTALFRAPTADCLGPLACKYYWWPGLLH